MPIHTTTAGWILETANTAYAFGLNQTGRLTHRYWGARLPYTDDYPAAANPREWASFDGPIQRTPEEYPTAEQTSYVEPCLKTVFADGTRDLQLRFVSAETSESALTITLQDALYPVQVELYYAVDPDHDLISRHAVIKNHGDLPVLLERAWSAQWHLPQGDGYQLTYLSGRWFDESHIRHTPLKPGIFRIESRRITSSHHHSPWFAVDQGDASEEQGAVWFGALAWSGNWALAAETTNFASTRVSIGVNDWDFAWKLEPGSDFTTPSCVGGYSNSGFGGAARLMHDYLRDKVLRHGKTPAKVIYNSWEATTFNIDATSQAALARQAADLGVEVFVMDDGWFQGRNDDHAGLGDWWPDAKKFPNGLSPLIKQVTDLGMEFGLWIEPEMVNPNSDLYRSHPDWVIHFPNRPRTEARQQLILNLGRTDVQDYLISLFDTLLSEHDISYIKWDMNRNVSEPGWPEAPGEPRELWVRYVEGVYRVWGTLRERHPNVTWLSCSGGGGRTDIGILRVADRIQISDNTDATAVLGLQQGISQFLPACTQESWIADVKVNLLPLSFRFHAAMCGILVIGANLPEWTAEEHAQATQLVAQYKELRPIIHLGDRYQLLPAQQSALTAVQFVAKDRREAVLFVFRQYFPNFAPDSTTLPTIRLRGLDPLARYTVDGIAEARSGAAWMQDGLQLALNDFESTLLRIRQLS